MPFPLLLDDDRKTFRAYGVRVLPTMILIDPDGKLFRGAVGVSNLEEVLARKLESSGKAEGK